TPVMVWMASADAGFIFFNQAWLDFTGPLLAGQLENGWAASMHPEDVTRCRETYRSEVDARRVVEMEYRRRRFHGQYPWMLDRGVPRYHPDGGFAGYIGSCIDITERRQSEDLQRYLAAIVDGSDDAIVSKTLDGVITSWNRGATRMFGYAADEAIGQSITLIIPLDRRDEEDGVLSCLRRGVALEHFETV